MRDAHSERLHAAAYRRGGTVQSRAALPLQSGAHAFASKRGSGIGLSFILLLSGP
jgi:hypothetical protein